MDLTARPANVYPRRLVSGRLAASLRLPRSCSSSDIRLILSSYTLGYDTLEEQPSIDRPSSPEEPAAPSHTSADHTRARL